jgi:NTE family protein
VAIREKGEEMAGKSGFLATVVILILAGCVGGAPGPSVKPRNALSEKCAVPGNKPSEYTDHEYLLALSGGGYRAMLFHVGALWRLNELGYLPRVSTISSVSGGSIVAGILAAKWENLNFTIEGRATCFEQLVAGPLIRLAEQTIDWPSVISGLSPFDSASDSLKREYAQRLFGNLALKNLPVKPKFIFNSVNYQTGEIWTFSKEKMGDALLGYIQNPDIEMATVVTASSAFPPFLAPMELNLSNVPSGNWILKEERESIKTREQRDKLRKNVLLVDGGVLDNLGLESISGKSKTLGNKKLGNIFVSDGSSGFERIKNPPTNWISQLLRVLDLIHSQPATLRTKNLIDRYKALEPDGVYWNMWKL